jgi:hypothetical protein
VEIFMYRTDVFAGPPIDITGFDVEATDGHVGKVDEATYEDGQGCLVVDTGFWIFGKKRLLPAGIVMHVDPEARKVDVSMTKDEIKNAPDYNAERHENEPAEYHDEVGPYYDPYR